MAKEYSISISAHPSIYKFKHRELNIYFSEPEEGVNNETGILLFISGFGGHANSNVYKKMRNKFADKYNLITLQCDYFGWEFMQGSDEVIINNDNILLTEDEEKKLLSKGKIDFGQLLNVANSNNITISCNAILEEDLTNFNDMGILQAIDNISAVLAVTEILDDNSLSFNKGKIMIYGHSHGAYLSYLCNAFAPKLFSLIIDNSAWLYPKYLEGNRYLYKSVGNTVIRTEFEYLAQRVFTDKALLLLPSLYKKFENNCKIITYQGIEDNLVPYKEKRKFCKKIKHCLYNEITDKSIDNEMFKSSNHGLNADFLKLFDYSVSRNKIAFEYKQEIKQTLVNYKGDSFSLIINYTKGLPIIDLNLW